MPLRLRVKVRSLADIARVLTLAQPHKAGKTALCGAELTAMLTCWATTTDITSIGQCAEQARAVERCMANLVRLTLLTELVDPSAGRTQAAKGRLDQSRPASALSPALSALTPTVQRRL